MYCTANPFDSVCAGRVPGVLYDLKGTFVNNSLHAPGGCGTSWTWQARRLPGPIDQKYFSWDSPTPGAWGFFSRGYFQGTSYSKYTVIQDSTNYSVGAAVGYKCFGGSGNYATEALTIVSVQRSDGRDGTVTHPLVPWQDWSQAKRDIAVSMIPRSDWSGWINTMPKGLTLHPGETLDVPKIIFPGQLDDPTTLEDESITKTIPGPWTVPSPYPNLDPNPSPSPSPSPLPYPFPSPSPSPTPSPTPPPPTNSADPPPNAPPPDEPSNPPNSKPGEVTSEILQEIHDTASSYNNLECVEFANKVEAYLREQGISGRRLKLDTTKRVSQDDYIIDDSFSGSEAISTNGHHEGIAITINGEEKVFDNNHGDGVPTEQWKNNLTFHSKEFFGAQFRESGYSF